MFEVVAEANRYFAAAEPWKLAKSDPERMRLVLYTTIETLRVAAILLQPVMPAAMGKLLDLLGVAPTTRAISRRSIRRRGGPIRRRRAPAARRAAAAARADLSALCRAGGGGEMRDAAIERSERSLSRWASERRQS